MTVQQTHDCEMTVLELHDVRAASVHSCPLLFYKSTNAGSRSHPRCLNNCTENRRRSYRSVSTLFKADQLLQSKRYIVMVNCVLFILGIR